MAREQDIREAIVKIYTIYNQPDYYNPWSMHGPRSSTGSGCIIKKRKIITNAHVVSDQTFVQVRRYGESKRYQARVLSISHHADLAFLTVDEPGFFQDVEPLELGTFPEPQTEVHVYGFPLGGDTLSITKGVISRIEHQIYTHSSVHLIAGQIDAAINPGNSGGPVISDNHIVGVVMQSIGQAENIGYMVPINVVEHFMTDIQDGTHDGFPSLGVLLQDMENPGLRRKYKMSENHAGVRVIKIFPSAPAQGFIQTNDIFLSVQGHPIADDGKVEFRPKQRTSVAYYIQEKQVGESIDVELLRDGTVYKKTIPLTRSLEEDWLIPMEYYDRIPSYYIYGGIVFCPLTKNLMKAWGSNWYNHAPPAWLDLLSQNHTPEGIDEVVLALKVLASDINVGYHKFSNWMIREVNGKKIRNLKELIQHIESATSPFIVFRNHQGQEMVLDRKKAESNHQKILQTYRIHSDRSDDLR
ncbi:MAG: trypsin-like serine protease [Kiritimatiellae bacterium]|nr:trypsin-like serine protease [Kiritimatiellia bacterium]